MKRFLLSLIICMATVISYAQADSVGVWAIQEGKTARMETIHMQKVKSTGALGFALTGGLSKIKAKLVFDEAQSETRFNREAHIRIYFGNPPIQMVRQLYMFSPIYSIKDFGIGEFEVKKNSRQLVTVRTGLLGTDMGADKSEDITIKTVSIREGVYELTITGKPGEYCLMHTTNGAGGYGGVFDFAIE